ncbi:hypothetical protein FHR99_000940 [Litorivivens lipolytica]|uniref:DNA-binding domain-containing protein n=1 Tax=Litorivivens lipolytica TaxID=1524264 RepID=A0A7W4W3G8_9GAMM|nr:putative DNA-binding domain-containing protein [Litorivivens lipolytica]MBB3046704.1 hypothetical protein [Litorivivens lipolytica]
MHFQQIQRSLTAHLRDPDKRDGPKGIESRRLGIYRDLIYNNIESFLSSGFPVLRSLYSDERWHVLVRDFVREHTCHSPYFLEISEEFLAYLQHERDERAGDPAFLPELAHYEWVELALDVAPDEVVEADPEGDLMAARPVLSPHAWPLVYRFPVHLIGEAFQPEEAPAEPTFLVVYRTPALAIEFMEINAVTYRLLALLEDTRSGREALAALANELQHNDPSQLEQFGADLLRQLRDAHILLGAACS